MAVYLTREDSVGLIHLNRPPVNAYDQALIDELDRVIEEVRGDASLRAVLVVSDMPKAFCGGADISVLKQSDPQSLRTFVERAQRTVSKLETLPQVVIAVIQGHAIGGGLELALACDLRFAADGDYRLGLGEVRLGLMPGMGGTQRLPRLIGPSRALWLATTGELIGPQQAYQWGVLDQLFPPDELLPRSMAFARSLASGASLAIAQIKWAIYRGLEGSLDSGLALERTALVGLSQTQDAREGLSAFLEKRPAQFAGR